MSGPFSYETAFARNIGWLTRDEQAILRSKRVSIAGLGGAGGSHLLTLTRLGIGRFRLSDFDNFELQNFNRQAGATLSHLDQPKLEVLRQMALDINPELEIEGFPQGVTEQNVDAFLQGVDLYVDALDFFALEARRAVFSACTRLGIPAITAAPLGMGTAVLSFLPGKMNFEEYFQLEGHSETEQLIRFLIGVSPAMLQTGYLVDLTGVDLPNHRAPSTPMGCELAAGVTGTQALKILLGRGKVLAAPWGLHIDTYRNRCKRTWRPGGNRHPLQQLGLIIARRRFGNALGQQAGPPNIATTTSDDPITAILDKARWAPSGDNTQPWRFEHTGEQSIRVHGFDTREHCVYDLDGRASQLSLGILLETIRIAASEQGLSTRIAPHRSAPETAPRFDIDFVAAEEPRDELAPYIPTRAVQRRPLSTRALTTPERRALESSVGDRYRVFWLEGWGTRLRVARLLSRNGRLRLTLPEAFETHRRVIQWNATESEDRIPDQAVGLDPMTLRLMRWVMGSWRRVDFFNRYLAGTWVPRLQLDLMPGLFCGAHFLILDQNPPEAINDYLAGGAAVQRFWLSAARLNLQLQPEMTPLIFSRYVREGLAFTNSTSRAELAAKLATELQQLVAPEPLEKAVFMGRIGAGPRPSSRSVRRPLEELMLTDKPEDKASTSI